MSENEIPHVIHRLWLGPRQMPDAFRRYGARWEELNPGWEVKDWSWHNLPCDLANADVLDDIRRRCTRGDSIELATALADVIDYDLVARFGGIYMNCDMEPVRPLELYPHLRHGAWAARESSNRIVNAAFGGVAGHWFWQAIVEELPRRYWRMREGGNENMVELTGPCLLTEMQENRGGLEIASQNAFSFINLEQVPRGGNADGLWRADGLPGDVVAIHHWHHRQNGRTNEVR